MDYDSDGDLDMFIPAYNSPNLLYVECDPSQLTMF